jgi:hypothetical protein
MSAVEHYMAEGGDRVKLRGGARVPIGPSNGGDPPDPGETVMLSSIPVDEEGIGWTFDGEYECGQYCNGDWFVVGPVTITAISPGWNGQDHGSMANPNRTNGQGFRANIEDFTDSVANKAGYSAALNAGASLPETFAAGTSLISSKTFTDPASHPDIDVRRGRPMVEAAAVLTVVSQVPPEGSFRPPYGGTDKAHRWVEADLEYAKLPKLALVGSTPDPNTLAALFARPWVSHPGNPVGARSVHPRNNMSYYGREIAIDTNLGALTLCMDYSDADMRDLLVNYCQVGIDYYGLTKSGMSNHWPVGDIYGYFHNGGHGHGRKLPIIVAGHFLGDGGMVDYAGDSDIWFQEDDQTFFVTSREVDATQEGDPNDGTVQQITASMLGMPEWGIRARAQATRTNAWPTSIYRRNDGGNGSSYGGMTMAARILGLKEAWNHDALFDYADRYLGLVTDPNWPAMGNTGLNEHNHEFFRQVWQTYRSSF